MDIQRVSGSVRRITVLKKDASGQVAPVIIYERKASKKKRGTRVFRPFERTIRRALEAQRRSADSYLSRHERSNEKRKDGWIRDLNINALRAGQRGTKALKVDRLFST
jgi:hypothetical protein